LPEHLARDFTEKNLDQSALNRMTYSICFASDMAGFTTIAETLKPKELASFLNDYFETLSEPLRRQGVDVIEFRADGIMCAWTAEQPEPGIRRKALLAGLEAIEAVAGFEKRYARFSHSLRIGLEDGMAYVGHAGGGGHFVYSIVGDCANTAARIEGLNKYLHTQLLTSRSAMEGVEASCAGSWANFASSARQNPYLFWKSLPWKRLPASLRDGSANASLSPWTSCSQDAGAKPLMSSKTSCRIIRRTVRPCFI
jgi:class 3 adenylate cyclase